MTVRGPSPNPLREVVLLEDYNGPQGGKMRRLTLSCGHKLERYLTDTDKMISKRARCTRCPSEVFKRMVAR